LQNRAVRRIAVPGADVRQLVWRSAGDLLAVVAPSGQEHPFQVPEPRSVVSVDLDSGSVSPIE
jgi:hypothetical protein